MIVICVPPMRLPRCGLIARIVAALQRTLSKLAIRNAKMTLEGAIASEEGFRCDGPQPKNGRGLAVGLSSTEQSPDLLIYEGMQT